MPEGDQLDFLEVFLSQEGGSSALHSFVSLSAKAWDHSKKKEKLFLFTHDDFFLLRTFKIFPVIGVQELP